MKKFMYMCMMLLAATLTFTACGSDDDDDNGGGQGGASITENQILGTWYGIDENTSERINIFVMTFTANHQGTYSEYKAKAKNNWQIETKSANMTWTLQNGTLNATVTMDGQSVTRKGDLLELKGNTIKVRRYLGEGETDVVTLTRASGAQEVATIITTMANAKQGGGGQGQGGNENNQDNYFSYSETANVQGAGEITVKGEAWFANGKCTKIQYSYIMPSKEAARQVKEIFDQEAEEWGSVTYDGNKTVTLTEPADEIEYYASKSKDFVCEEIKYIVHETVVAMQGGGGDAK